MVRRLREAPYGRCLDHSLAYLDERFANFDLDLGVQRAQVVKDLIEVEFACPNHNMLARLLYFSLYHRVAFIDLAKTLDHLG